MGVFKFEGKRWPARRWAAAFIHDQPIDGREVTVTCGEPLCVQHVKSDYPLSHTRQDYLLEGLGYREPEPDESRERSRRVLADAHRDANPFPTLPGWFKPFFPVPARETRHVPA
jgi:hypothetical protein